ncbi:peptide-methionine (S)-S-oxide reductase [Cyclobacterium qasimii]|uniref:peptide-methionine (S)-S-oxide reductase n=2 Tax=Cyclobacterium qasimii TaxID=1350429 RepID=S7WIC5_9BACT|nr:peptide-methionine (S)-S-oxide reductase [Cyclobacterium qasimii]EPR66479.1 Peptide methionine sulfoxide reductase MsrA [Cyclobacterium qasimii M12-11B]GEO21080.1 peptide methionine sulfoxide reductase MsrA [Cyclobacterium qasimii]
MKTMKVGVGGGCHWCTEGVFRSVLGVKEVKQGWISSEAPNKDWSEGVEITFDPLLVDLSLLIAIHLHSHSCTSDHAFRQKYRSAIYYFNEEQEELSKSALLELQRDFDAPIVTKVIPFVDFKMNTEQFLDYYKKNPDLPFCINYIKPKLNALKERFQKQMVK